MGMKNIGALFAIILIAVGLSGCSQDGDLIVKNETSTEFQGYVEGKSVVIDRGMEYRTNIYIGKTLAVVGPKDINVTISGSAWTKKSFTKEIKVTSGETTTFSIINDTGACAFSNNYHLPVNAVSKKDCDSTEFDLNLLEKGEAILPAGWKVLQLDPGCWDILVNYSMKQDLDTVTHVEIEVGAVDTVAWAP